MRAARAPGCDPHQDREPPRGRVAARSDAFDATFAPAAAVHTADAPEATADTTDAGEGAGFDRDRVLRLLDQLERDVVAVESAMVHVEAGAHDEYAAAVALLEPQLSD
jgi:hypothetical protein